MKKTKNEPARYIKQIKIRNFMSRGKDLVWDLKPTANILGGANGSGKTMLLSCIHAFMKGRSQSDTWLYDSMEMTVCENGTDIIYRATEPRPQDIPVMFLSEDMASLDYDFMEYDDAVWTDAHPASRKKFAGLLNRLLSGKGVNMDDKVYLTFITSVSGVKKILRYEDLTFGEQRLIMMLSMAWSRRNDKDGILFLMDQPDLGLHVDIVRKLLVTLRSINPSLQIICCTHTPQLIEGWYDNVREIKQLYNNKDEEEPETIASTSTGAGE